MLNPDRKHYVTASQAYRVMAGFEAELTGKKAVTPEFKNYPSIAAWIDEKKAKPLVRDLKDRLQGVNTSEINEAWDYKKSQVKVFSEGMESVAREIAMYSFIQKRDESYKSADMERGNIQEGEAVISLSNFLGTKFTGTEENQKFLTRGNLGVTPDGVEMDGFNYRSCAEVKNPKDETHMKYLHLLKSQQDMLKICPNYYWQHQAGLHVTDAEIYHWASYHKEFDKECRLVYVPAYPVAEHIEMLVERSDRVIGAVPAIIDDIKNRYFQEAKKAA